MSCVRQRALPGSGVSRAGARRPAISSHRSMAGSAKALTHQTWRGPRRCSMSWR